MDNSTKTLIEQIEELFNGQPILEFDTKLIMQDLSYSLTELENLFAPILFFRSKYILDVNSGFIGHTDESSKLELYIYDINGKNYYDDKPYSHWKDTKFKEWLQFLWDFITYIERYDINLYPYENIISDINHIINSLAVEREELKIKFGIIPNNDSKECYLISNKLDRIGCHNHNCNDCEKYSDCLKNYNIINKREKIFY